ncbi:MAG: ATP-binding protein [Leptospiraceae bacterium]|nr:ATP-binding protein [Leptospiraceae bacterium]
MKLGEIIPHEKTGMPNCEECGGTGIVLDEIVENSRTPGLSICLCVREHCFICPSSGKPPYLVYDAEVNRMLPCYCNQSRKLKAELERMILKANIPPKYQYKFLSSVDISGKDSLTLLAAHDWARDLAENYTRTGRIPQGMYLTGAPGTGKTLLACVILNELIFRYRINCRYAKITKDFLNALRDTYQKDSDSYGQEKNIEKEFNEVEVLVIDDFGVQKDTEWANAKLYDLIDARYERQKLTLLTSNQPLIDWKEKGVGRVYSRLYEMTKEIKLECPDYRLNHLK